MLLRWYRRKIAKQVEEKMNYLDVCPNARDMVLWIIAPKDYEARHQIFHCNTDCTQKGCSAYKNI